MNLDKKVNSATIVESERITLTTNFDMETNVNNTSEPQHDAKLPVIGSAFSIHDLKCGNLLNYDTAEGEILPTVIDWQDLKWLAEDPKGFNLVHSPVYLSGEWLEKLGFDKIQNEAHKVRVGLDGDDFVKHQMTYMFNKQFVAKIKYVHELQNLHYSLTGVMLSLS